MTTINIITIFATAFITLAAVSLLLRLIPKTAKHIRLVISIVLIGGFCYLIFAIQPLRNNLLVLTGIQWGLFGGALTATGIGQRKVIK